LSSTRWINTAASPPDICAFGDELADHSLGQADPLAWIFRVEIRAIHVIRGLF
jgi:hypothetical protein